MTDPTWYFGDGSSAIVDEFGSATHAYPDPGTYFAAYVHSDGGILGVLEIEVSGSSLVAIGHAAWTAPEDDGGCAVDLYRAFSESGEILYEGPDLTFEMGEVDPAACNAIRVMAHNCRGWGPLSARSPCAVVAAP